MIAEIISPLTEQEREQEKVLIDKILKGIQNEGEAQAAIIAAIVEIKDKKLWRSYGSIEEWTERAIGLSPRMVNYYLTSADVTKRIQLVDPEVKSIPVTHATLMARFSPEDQASLWTKANERAKELKEKFTAKLIGKVANELTKSGEIHLRDGVSPPNPNHTAHTPEQLKKSWFRLVAGDRADVFNHMVKNETYDFLQVMKAMINHELEGRNPEDESSHNYDDDSE